MPDDSPPSEVQGATFDAIGGPLTRDVQKTLPVHGLLQPYYYLSHAEFKDLGQTSNFWSELGKVVALFGIGYALEPATLYLEARSQNPSAAVFPLKVKLGGAFLLGGLLVYLIGYYLLSKRRKLMRKIETHFEENPGRTAESGCSR